MTDSGDPFNGGYSLSCLIEGLNNDCAKSKSEAPHLVRKRLEQLISDPDFHKDCAELLLAHVAHHSGREVLFEDPSSRYSLQIFIWPPGFANEPHLHENWNVSGMMQNSLVVLRSSISESDCLESDPLSVVAGQVGVLIPPQFHCFRNEGSEAAVTFHVFSHDTSSRGELAPTPVQDIPQTFDDDDIFAIAKMSAAGSQDERSANLIRTAFTLVEAPTKLRIVKMMAMIDPGQALRLGNVLCGLISEEDAARLNRALTTFLHAALDHRGTPVIERHEKLIS